MLRICEMTENPSFNCNFLGRLFGGIEMTRDFGEFLIILSAYFDITDDLFLVDDGRDVRPHYNSLRHGFRTILNQEGVRGFYKGVTPNVAGAGTAWGFYFLL